MKVTTEPSRAISGRTFADQRPRPVPLVERIDVADRQLIRPHPGIANLERDVIAVAADHRVERRSAEQRAGFTGPPIAKIQCGGRVAETRRVRREDDVAAVGADCLARHLARAVGRYRRIGGGRRVLIVPADQLDESIPPRRRSRLLPCHHAVVARAGDRRDDQNQEKNRRPRTRRPRQTHPRPPRKASRREGRCCCRGACVLCGGLSSWQRNPSSVGLLDVRQ